MAYYPKSQVKTNLYTNGDEFVRIDDRSNYKGAYWENSRGQFFTGKNPQEKPVVSLIVQEQDTDETPVVPKKNSYWNRSYPNTIIQDNPGLSPNKNTPLPTDSDYTIGEFTRYFTKKTNQNIYYEISKEDYSKLINQDMSIKWQLYQGISLIWDLKGDKDSVYKANKNTVMIVEQQQLLPGFSKIFRKDYLQYYKI